MTIISCSYKKRVGKDTAFLLAKELYPHKNIIKIAFADALKDEIYELFLKPFNIERSYLDDDATKENLRPLMQAWGNARRELINPSYWMDKAFEKINDPDAIYIITDCRYLNELKYIKSLGGTCLHIYRGFDDSTHLSEIELDNHHDLFDYAIDNNGTLESYKEKLHTFFNWMESNGNF